MQFGPESEIYVQLQYTALLMNNGNENHNRNGYCSSNLRAHVQLPQLVLVSSHGGADQAPLDQSSNNTHQPNSNARSPQSCIPGGPSSSQRRTTRRGRARCNARSRAINARSSIRAGRACTARGSAFAAGYSDCTGSHRGGHGGRGRH